MKTKTQIRFIYLELLMTNAATVINRIIKGGSLYKKKKFLKSTFLKV